MSDQTERSRREYLLLAGGVSTLGTAGCTSSGTGGNDEDESEETQSGGGMGAGNDSDSSTQNGGTTNADEPDDGSTDTAPARTVEVYSNEFSPPWIEVDVGETVEWTLEEGSHTVTLYHRDNDAAEHRAPDGVDAFDDALDDGSFQWTFETAGVYDYFCRPHESGGMAGTVIVGAPTADEPGLTSPSALPDGAAGKIEDLNTITREEFDLEQPSDGGGTSSDDSTSDDDGTSDDSSTSDDDGYDGGYGY